MTAGVPSDRRSFWRVGPESTWTTIVPVVFIIISLLSLVILPLVVSHHTSQMRREISSLAEPARRAATQIQTDLSAELDKLIAYQVTGQSNYRQDYYKLIERQEANRRTLDARLPQLQSELKGDVSALFVQMTRWHAGVATGEFLTRPLPREVFLTRLFEQHVAYEKSLLAASALELAIQEGIENRLNRIREAERINVSLTIILTLLALISALLVAGLGRQMRLLAREAVRRRLDAEREATEATRAREAAEREERRAAFLSAAGQELAASLDYEQTMTTFAHLIVPNLAEACVIDLAEDEGLLRRAAIAHCNPEEEVRLTPMTGTVRKSVPEALVRIMQSREALVVGLTSGLLQYITDESDVREGARTLLFMPLVSRGQSIGVVSAVSSEARPFTDADLPLFYELARRASLAVDNARLYLDSQQAVREREEVLAIVSHDLRNPLNGVMLGASMLETAETLTDDEREQVETIALSARRMNRLIADLLDVTRLEGGKRLPIDPLPLPASVLLDEVYELFKAQAAASAVDLRIDLSGDPPDVIADRHRVMQVLSNLVGNSMKFTPADGSVTVRCSTRDQEALFAVSDTGPGIPAENLNDIFSPYWQAKRAERLGAGLGLPIAKGIVESHGGRIWAESVPGRGTSFYFTLPLAPRVAESEAGR